MKLAGNTMKFKPSSIRPLLTATLLALAGLSANAATYNFNGVTDSGPLAGSMFSGSFSFADPAPADDSAALSAFSLVFDGNTYTLAGADPAPAARAYFFGGAFIGVDYADMDSFATGVALTAGFTDVGEAFFSYSSPAPGFDGAGSIVFTQVPEPGSAPLLLAGLAVLAVVRRRQQTAAAAA